MKIQVETLHCPRLDQSDQLGGNITHELFPWESHDYVINGSSWPYLRHPHLRLACTVREYIDCFPHPVPDRTAVTASE